MNGGRIGKVSGAALIAAAGILSGGIAAQAADLGGNCCADLEERVAELEATTARKGNRKVSLTISGHVNEAVLYYDDGERSGARVVTNGFSMTRFRFKGSAKINADWSAGFYLEFGLGRTGMSYAVDQESGAQYGGYGTSPSMRHQALWIKSRSLGTFWIGHTTDAVDGLIDTCLGCPITSSSEANLGWGNFVAFAPAFGVYSGATFAQMGVGQEGYYATRRNLIKYVSPTFAGFSLSASWGDADDGDATYLTTGRDHGYIWNAALRYAGEFGAIRIAAAAGYTSQEFNDTDSWAVAASLQHVPTGLYVHGNYRTQELALIADGGSCPILANCEDDAWAVQIGIAQRWSSLGKTTIWAQYAEHENGYKSAILNDGPPGTVATADGVDAQIISVGINQKIDAAAMELYLTYWNIQTDAYDVTVGGGAIGNVEFDDLNVVMAGARIKF